MTFSILLGFVLSLPVWRTERVIVKGNVYLPEDKIINTAKVPIGENIFMIDMDEVKGRFSKVIQIKDLKVKRKLPGTIELDITERKPFAIAVIGSTTTLIDEDGYIIAKQASISSIYGLNIADYPVIRGISAKSLDGGMRLNSSDRIFIKDALTLLSSSMDPGQVQLEVGKRDDIVIFLEDIVKVKIGDASEIARKIKIMQALLDSIKDKWVKVAYIDVRVPDAPVIKFK